MVWETTNKSSLPEAIQLNVFHVIEWVIYGQCWLDSTAQVWHWRTNIDEVSLEQGECDSEEEAKEEVENSLFKLFERQRDIWFAHDADRIIGDGEAILS